MTYLENLFLPEYHVDYLPFWEGCRNHCLLIQYCHDCGRYRHYPRPVCPACRSWNSGWKQVSGKGEIWSYTVIRDPVDPMVEGKVPYNIIEVELVEQKGLRLISNLVDRPVEKIHIGMPVKVVFEPATAEITLPRFAYDPSRRSR